MLVDEEECALEITLFRAWRSVMEVDTIVYII